MDAGDVREVFETVLPEEALMTTVQAAGLQTQERKIDARRLLRAMASSSLWDAALPLTPPSRSHPFSRLDPLSTRIGMSLSTARLARALGGCDT